MKSLFKRGLLFIGFTMLFSSCALFFLLPEKPKALPVSAVTDSALEGAMLKAIREHAKSMGWEEDFQKIIINSDDWTTVRNSVTGVILGRKREAAACAKWPDGHCTFQFFDFWQDETGGAYSSRVVYYGTGEQQTCVCDSIKK